MSNVKRQTLISLLFMCSGCYAYGCVCGCCSVIVVFFCCFFVVFVLFLRESLVEALEWSFDQTVKTVENSHHDSLSIIIINTSLSSSSSHYHQQQQHDHHRHQHHQHHHHQHHYMMIGILYFKDAF